MDELINEKEKSADMHLTKEGEKQIEDKYIDGYKNE